LAGQDILIEPPQYVSLNLAFTICVDPDYFQRDVQQALLQTLGSGTLPMANRRCSRRRTLNWDKLSTSVLSMRRPER